MLTDAELDAMQARCDAATPGPWVTLVFAGRHTNSYRDLISISNKTAMRVDGKPFKNGKDRLRWFDPTRDDGDFIAESRTDLPRLIAAYRELRQELSQAIADQCDDDTEIRTAAKTVLPPEWVDGDSYSVPDPVAIVKRLVDELADLKARVANGAV